MRVKKNVRTGSIACLFTVTLLFISSPISAQLHPTGLLVSDTIPDWILPSPAIELKDGYDASCDHSANLPPIGNQGAQGSCTAWAAGYYFKTYQEWEEHGWDVTLPEYQFSPAFVFNQINGGGNGGSYFEDALKLLCDLGCANLVDMPYDQLDYTTWPDESDYFNAMNYRSDQSYYLDLFAVGLNDLKNHLLNGHVAITGIHVWSNFDNIQNFNYTYCVSEVYGENRGGHAVTLCGFDDDLVTADGVGAFKLVNSWGTFWGDAGYFWMSYEALLNDTTCFGGAYYTDDLIGHTPTFIARLQVTHDDRYAVVYRLGVGNYASPLWSKDFFNWYRSPFTALPYPPANIVIDLTDGASFLTQGVPNSVFTRCEDTNTLNGLDGNITYFMAEELSWPEFSVSADPPVLIPDNGSYAYATLEIGDQLQPNIAASSDTLDFSTVTLGTPTDLLLTLYNTGDTTLVIYDIALGEPCFSTDYDPADSLILPGDSLEITVTFTPADTIAYTDTLGIDNNDEFYGVIVNGSGEQALGIEENELNVLPAAFAIRGPYPNPFNPITTFEVELPTASRVSLEVYDVRGSRVVSVFNGSMPAGYHEIAFDGSGLSSGVYIYAFQAGALTITGKVVLMK